MTEAQINCFLEVIKEGSFSKAALSLYISQPAISKNVAKLEEELGFPLLERKGPLLIPTPAGKKLASFWHDKNEEFDILIHEIKDSLTVPRDTIFIGVPHTWNPEHFYEKLQTIFENHFPNLTFSLLCDRLPNLLSDLQAGKLDMILTHDFHPQLQYGYESAMLTSTGSGILFSNKFCRNVKEISDLKELPILVFDSDMEKSFLTHTRKQFLELGISPKIKNCGLYSSALFEMSCGRGIMIFTDWDTAISNSSYTYLSLNNQLPVNVIYHRSKNQMLNNLVKVMCKMF